MSEHSLLCPLFAFLWIVKIDLLNMKITPQFDKISVIQAFEIGETYTDRVFIS